MMSHRRDERGAVAVFTAILALVLLMIAAFAVDIGNTWAHRGKLQVQADRAATYAAQSLPARNDESRFEVAKAVAYYLACHPVSGQRALNPTMPECPEDAESSSLDTYANELLNKEMVTFPAGNQVSVVTPKARIAFAFGGVVGAEGSIQQKQATAKVTSPGLLSPMALSLDCLLNTGANVLGGGGLPFGYISTTHKAPTDGEEIATTWSGPTQDAPSFSGIDPDIAEQYSAPPTVEVSGREWPELTGQQTFQVVFALGSGLDRQEYAASGVLELEDGKNTKRRGAMHVTVPAQVMAIAGTWQVKVAVVTQSGSRTYSVSTGTFEVTPAVNLPDDISCGRLIKSPRGGTQANENFILNLQEGIDHLVETFPTVLPPGGLTRDDLLELTELTQCGNGGVTDTNGQSGTPNCLVTKMSNAYEAGFTEGLIGANGRLTCTQAHTCLRSFQLNGRAVNDDRFTDFVKNPSLLTSSTFFNLDTYLNTEVPLVTPTSNLKREIYGSGRFMWVAVISTAGATSEVQAGDYGILTFRPIFVTQASALETLPLLDESLLNLPLLGNPLTPLQTAINDIDDAMTSALGSVNDQGGLMMDSDGQLRAIRFMTISPDALPAVPAEYAGPESEYFGVGPRIIRLVR